MVNVPSSFTKDERPRTLYESLAVQAARWRQNVVINVRTKKRKTSDLDRSVGSTNVKAENQREGPELQSDCKSAGHAVAWRAADVEAWLERRASGEAGEVRGPVALKCKKP